MKRVDLLSLIALVVAIAAVFLYQAEKLPGNRLDYYLIGAGVLVLVHLFLRAPDIGDAIGARQMRHGGNVLALTLAVTVILVAVNWLADRHDKRWDLTKSQRFSFSEQTRKVLGGLKEDIKITYFHQKAAMENGRMRLEIYEALSPHIKAEFVDPMVDPVKAEAFDARSPQLPIIVLDRGSRREKITSDSETDITNAIIKVSRDTKKTVCFMEGEGERDIDDNQGPGVANAKAALAAGNYVAQRVSPIRDGKLPEACTVVIIAGPSKDLLPQVIDVVRSYVKNGGKVLFLVEWERQGSFPNLVALLKEWNVEVQNNVIWDPSSVLAGMGPLTPVSKNYPYHDITRDFREATVFHTARGVRANTATTEGVTAQNLVESSRYAWGETDLNLKEPVQQDPQDTRGPVSMAVAVTLRAPVVTKAAAEDMASGPESRVVVVGDADFASNQLLRMAPGNEDFFLNTIAWLVHDSELIAIRPVAQDQNRLFLTQSQNLFVLVFSVFVIPGLFVVGGIVGWWRRRRG
jgi:ABC-type uncharacterized transport system involved in gliding motility auxiliary subunit